jgi:1-deoxy-D-xylulose-5-phosphate reductoisomerase
MIRLNDGAVYAQMSRPDMRLPIHEALYWPATQNGPFGVLDFGAGGAPLTLTFEPPDTEKFPLLPLACRALDAGPLYPAVYNAANEEAAWAFLDRKIAFTDIARVVEYALRRVRPGGDDRNLDEILAADRAGRSAAQNAILDVNNLGCA